MKSSMSFTTVVAAFALAAYVFFKLLMFGVYTVSMMPMIRRSSLLVFQSLPMQISTTQCLLSRKAERSIGASLHSGRMIWGSPLTWWMIPIFYFPGAVFFGVRIYAWVAKNRLKFGCRSESCALPGTDKPGPRL
ncbi:MAG: hypothetical protein KatS3mg082_1547 [Nitrospiraceae bacterium]|nr:MAG: hypothetical protein KatS3mg082_1547 [Nitrospiraceae bacterium]